MGLADDRKPVNLMTVHVSKSVTAHEVSNNLIQQILRFIHANYLQNVMGKEFRWMKMLLVQH